MPERVGEKEWAEPESYAAEERGDFVAANAETQQSSKKCAESQLHNQRQIIGDDRAGEQAERQRENSGERIERAPSQICACGIEEQVRVEGIVTGRNGSGEMPEEPCVLEVVSGITEERGRRRERSRQSENCGRNHAKYKSQQMIAHGCRSVRDARRIRGTPDGTLTTRRCD